MAFCWMAQELDCTACALAWMTHELHCTACALAWMESVLWLTRQFIRSIVPQLDKPISATGNKNTSFFTKYLLYDSLAFFRVALISSRRCLFSWILLLAC